VHHHGQREARLERVSRDERDLGEVLVVAVGADLAGVPLEDEVGRRDAHDLTGAGVEGVLAGQQRVTPHAALAGGDQLTVLVVVTRNVRARAAGVGHDDADGADLDDGRGDELDGGEQAVDVPGALDHDRELASAAAAGCHEGVGVLEVVARLDGGRDELTLGEGAMRVHAASSPASRRRA
jgi:hypothetical protein